MIDYVLTAFFVAQPVPLATSAARPSPAASSSPLRPDAPVEITSKRVTGSRDQAVFSGDVVARQRTLELRCDNLTAFYTGPRQLTRLEGAGHVRAQDGERTAQGEHAVLDVPSGRLVVTGEPEARDPTTHLRGSEIRLLTQAASGARPAASGGPQGMEYEVDNAIVTLESAPLPSARRPGGKDAAPRQPAEITSRRVVGSRTQAVFTGDVVVRQRTLELRCDRMIAFLNGPTNGSTNGPTSNGLNEVSRAECMGHVRAQDGVRQAKGERATFDVPAGVLWVTGNPEARDATTHLRGSEVRMTIGDSNFEVKDAVVTVESTPSLPPGKRPGNPPTGSTRRP